MGANFMSLEGLAYVFLTSNKGITLALLGHSEALYQVPKFRGGFI
jgi:hypothetical protein